MCKKDARLKFYLYAWLSALHLANRMYQDQARQNVGPDLDPNCLTLQRHFLKDFLKKLILKKIADDKKDGGQRVDD